MMEYPSFEEVLEPELIGEKISYENNEADYARFEEFKKQHRTPPVIAIAVLVCMTLFSAYEIYMTKQLAHIGVWLAALFLFSVGALYNRYSGGEKAVKKYIKSDPYYTSQRCVTFYEDRAEFFAFDPKGGNEIFNAVYPYSLADSIVVTIDDYYFIIGGRAFIVPRRYTQALGADTKLLDTIKKSGKMADER